MIKIGITGSVASGKTTASKIISKNKGLLFNADKVVRRLYRKKSFKKLVAKKLGFKYGPGFKKTLKNKILYKKENLNKLEKMIHPIVRNEMFLFKMKNKNQKYLFFEIPLLIESKLTQYFDKIIFLKANKNIRLQRYKQNGGDDKLFKILDNNQIKDTLKMNICNHVIVNNKTFSILKKKLLNIIINNE